MSPIKLDMEHPLAGVVITFVTSKRLYFGALALLGIVSLIIVVQRWLLAEGTGGYVAASLHTAVVIVGLPLLIRFSVRRRTEALVMLSEVAADRAENGPAGK